MKPETLFSDCLRILLASMNQMYSSLRNVKYFVTKNIRVSEKVIRVSEKVV